MKKNGFTLVELIAVIAILGVIMTVGGVSIYQIIASQQQSLLEEQLKNLQDTALTYAYAQKITNMISCGQEDTVDPTKLTNSKCYKKVKVQDLIDTNFFENKNDLCNKDSYLTIYKVNTIGINYELKVYVPEGTCFY